MKRIFLFLLLFLSHFPGIKAQEEKIINTGLVYRVNLPSKKSDRMPVLIILHGYGSNEGDLFDLAKTFDERFITFAIRGPYSAGAADAYSWFELKKDEKGNRTFNYKEATESRKKILSFISHACREYKADSTQVFIMGFSQGAMMSYDIAFAAPTKIKGALPLSGLLMPESRSLKPKDEQLSKVSFFVAHGTQDNILDIKFAHEVNDYFTAKKFPITYKEYQMPHSLCGKELNDIKDFFKKNLKAEKQKEPAKKPDKPHK